MGKLRLKEVNGLALGLRSRSTVQIVCLQFQSFLGHLLWMHSVDSQQSIFRGGAPPKSWQIYYQYLSFLILSPPNTTL